MIRVYGYTVNGNGAIVSVANDGTVRCYRVINNIATVEGEMEGDVMAHAVRTAVPMKGNVNPAMMRAVECAMELAIKGAR